MHLCHWPVEHMVQESIVGRSEAAGGSAIHWVHT